MRFLFILLIFHLSSCAADEPRVSSAIHLVVPERADLMAKYIYAKHRDWGVSHIFATDLYYEHLKVWNGFFEKDPPKMTFEDFLHSYHDLLDAVKNGTYISKNIILPIDRHGRIRDGAHRTAACLFYHQPVFLTDTPFDTPGWSLEFFEERGLERKFLDAMAIQYCELRPNTYMMVIFPSAVGRQQEVESILSRYAWTVYRKKVFLTASGGLNLILHAYDGEPFIYRASGIDFGSARFKAEACFPHGLIGSNPARIYLLEFNTFAQMKECKAEIRTLFDIGNHSVHVTDTHEQAIVLAKALFNKNSLHFLNHAKHVEFSNSNYYFAQYKNWLFSNGIDDEKLCVDSGAVLSLYGLRDCNDWDYIHFGEEYSHSGIPGIDGHNHELCHHRWDKERIIFDPDYHFFYKGIKCCSLQVVRAMKEKRGEAKDKADIALIDVTSK